MVAPQACVAVEIAGPSAAQEQRAALEQRCSEILGARRCRIVLPGQADDPGAVCWRAKVTAEGEGTPAEASVVLRDDTEPTHVPVRRDITFRPNDALTERWATLGLVIAALVTVEEHSAAEAAPAPLPPPPKLDAPDAPVVVSPPQGAPVPGEPWDGSLGVSGVVALGLLPSAAFGARLEASLARGPVGALARATIFPGESRATLGGSAAGDVQLASAGLGVFGLVTRGPWTWRFCAAGEAARLEARGSGVAETSTAVDWSAALSAGASLGLRLASHFALTAEAEAVTLLRRPTFAIDGAPQTFTPAPVGGIVGLGMAVPF